MLAYNFNRFWPEFVQVRPLEKLSSGRLYGHRYRRHDGQNEFHKMRNSLGWSHWTCTHFSDSVQILVKFLRKSFPLCRKVYRCLLYWRVLENAPLHYIARLIAMVVFHSRHAIHYHILASQSSISKNQKHMYWTLPKFICFFFLEQFSNWSITTISHDLRTCSYVNIHATYPPLFNTGHLVDHACTVHS